MRAALRRVERLVRAARRVASRVDPLGRRARSALPAVTGLSPAGVELALERCLETQPSMLDLEQLCRSVPRAPAAHVLLSANVFVAAHRAIALGLASSPRVLVHASRRDPVLAGLLHEATDELFELATELSPAPDDHVWAYGTEQTLAALRRELPRGVILHAHGPGMGVAIVDPDVAAGDLQAPARALAADVVPFDQRGCLSPRVAFWLGDERTGRRFGEALAAELARLDRVTPRGQLWPEEEAELARYREVMTFCGDLIPAGTGCVGVSGARGAVIVPPVGRAVQVVAAQPLSTVLSPLAALTTAAGVWGPPSLVEHTRALLPKARLGPLGAMQRPAFDGPVDRRTSPTGERL